MKRNWWIFLLVLLFVVGNGVTIYAYTEISEEDGVYFDSLLTPSFRYNSIEHWRWGGAFLGLYTGEVGQMLLLNSDFSFYDHSLHASGLYIAEMENLSLYAKLSHDLSHRGIFKDGILWQMENEICGGMTYRMKWNDGMLNTHLIGTFLDLNPLTAPGGYQFDSGKELTLYTGLNGAYRGVEGNLEVEYGLPGQFTDFDFIKSELTIKTGFDLTEMDRIRLGGAVGVLRGNYPTQEQFFLGGSQVGIVPNLGKQFAWLMNNGLEFPYQPTLLAPKLYLMGFQQGAFAGNNKYLASMEYQRKLPNDDLDDESFVRTFVILGDAWEGAFEPTERPNLSVGIGYLTEPKLVDYIQVDPISVSFDLAYGFGENGAVTAGFEVGMAVNYTDLYLLFEK